MSEDAATKTPGQSSLGAIVGWGGLTLGTIAFIWFIATQLGVGWAGREQEALELVKNFKNPQMKYTLADQTIEIGNAARAKGFFVGQFAWSATHDDGPNYKVEMIWKDRDDTKKAAWKVNLEDKDVQALGPDAAQFMKPIE